MLRNITARSKIQTWLNAIEKRSFFLKIFIFLFTNGSTVANLEIINRTTTSLDVDVAKVAFKKITLNFEHGLSRGYKDAIFTVATDLFLLNDYSLMGGFVRNTSSPRDLGTYD
ncbi:unnamed protein product [Pieris brassicae]|uniref:Uncharacterized protein n=1 Tax=Pieris brassicae TaxID=7116 RepID=A0A9P0TCV8_PIEBR|nr:unnamed protein product [Pieris brassicae]